MSEKITECECPMAGFCKRHGVHKSAHLHKLCQNHPKYFNLWEKCRGPNQNPNDCIKHSEPNEDGFQPETTISELKEDVKLPSTVQMAKNFIQSTANHVKNGMKYVDSNLQQERLDICSKCPFLTENGSRCGKCGCFLQTKTKWASSTCPIGKW